jgi:hypothetical protein
MVLWSVSVMYGPKAIAPILPPTDPHPPQGGRLGPLPKSLPATHPTNENR